MQGDPVRSLNKQEKSVVSGAAATTLQKQSNLAGIGFMAGAVFIFSVNDALGKWLAAGYEAPQILLFRSVLASVLLIPIIRRVGWRALIGVDRPLLQALRAALSVGETAMFYWAVKSLPLADTMTYYLAGPIYVTVMAAIFLGEKVGWRRWLAVLVGFIGVIIALGPSAASFGGAALVAFSGSLIYSVFIIVTRVLRGTPDTVMAAWQIGAGVVFGLLGAPFVWAPLGHWYEGVMLGALGIGALLGTIGINRSLVLAPASVVVPYQYTMIVWAAIFGYFVFGNVPSSQTLVGAVIIVGAGLFIFFREQQAGAPAEPELPPER